MPASKAQQAATAKRRAAAIGLRLAGLDYQTIADRLEYPSRGAACTDIQRALEASLREQARDLEVWRHELLLGLMRLRAAMWPAAMAGDAKAADVVLRISDRISKLTGADAPIRHEVITIGAVEAEIARLTEQLGDTGDGKVVPPEWPARLGPAEVGPPA